MLGYADRPRGMPRMFHSFVVRIWIEETAEEAGHAQWRGHITHVPDGTRTYLRSLDDIPAFIGPYLFALGVRSGLSYRLRHWMRQCRWGR